MKPTEKWIRDFNISVAFHAPPNPYQIKYRNEKNSIKTPPKFQHRTILMREGVRLKIHGVPLLIQISNIQRRR